MIKNIICRLSSHINKRKLPGEGGQVVRCMSGYYGNYTNYLYDKLSGKLYF